MKLSELFEGLFENDYRGSHDAPTNNGFSKPIYNLEGIYPDDIYGPNAARYYGDGSAYDNESIYTIQSLRNKPKARLKIYRAVPKVLSNTEMIAQYEKEMAYIQKTGKLPKYVDNFNNRSEYYNHIYNEIERLKQLPDNSQEKMSINVGDWVTINKKYAIDHGKSNLNGKYRILSKTVNAKDVWTDGGSIHEFGYDPQ